MKNIVQATLAAWLLLFTLFAVLVQSPICHAEVLKKGFYPVSRDDGGYSLPPNATGIPHNPYYKEWCNNTFVDGSEVYDAYRQIAFNVAYKPEPPKVDLWQTPAETAQIHSGDCEDAILLFHHLLPACYSGGEVIWGFVHDTKEQTAFAHVWFQLYDKNGKAYVVEPFSGDWNGIIPVEMISGHEVRQKIIGIPNAIVSDIMRSPSASRDIKEFFMKQMAVYDWRLVKQIDDVFAKLTAVSRRYTGVR